MTHDILKRKHQLRHCRSEGSYLSRIMFKLNLDHKKCEDSKNDN